MAAVTAIAAIVAILTGILLSKAFLIYVGVGLFLLGYLGTATLAGNGVWVITLIIVLVIIIKVLKKK